MTKRIADLPSAFESEEEIAARLEGKRLAVFLDYDGTLTPIVDRPELAVMADSMRSVVRDLAARCTLAIVSGRDRPDVQKLVGLDDLIYAGSHGFDIAGPDGLSIQRQEGEDFSVLLEEVNKTLHQVMDPIDGALIEPKKASVAAHYRLVAEEERHQVKEVVDAIVAQHPELRVTPGKMVYEIQPRIEWNKGKAVLYLLEALDLDKPDVMAMYFGDDITDEDAFNALVGSGIGIFAGEGSGPDADRPTAADYRVKDTDEVGLLLQSLAR